MPRLRHGLFMQVPREPRPQHPVRYSSDLYIREFNARFHDLVPGEVDPPPPRPPPDRGVHYLWFAFVCV